MALNSAVFENAEYKIVVKRMYGGSWYVQVMTGMAGSKHVETTDFGTYDESIDYIFEKYDLATD